MLIELYTSPNKNYLNISGYPDAILYKTTHRP